MSDRLRTRPRRALILTGLQRAYCEPHGDVAATGANVAPMTAIIPAAAALLAEARAAGAVVVHLVEAVLPAGRSDSPAWRRSRLRGATSVSGDLAAEIVAPLRPREGEIVVERYRTGGFIDTRTEVLLRSNAVGTVVIAGVETHGSVLATAIEAVELDYDVFVAEDCVAARDPGLQRVALDVLRLWTTVAPARRADLRGPGGAREEGGRP